MRLSCWVRLRDIRDMTRLKPSVPYVQSAFWETACLDPNYLVKKKLNSLALG